MLVLSRKVDETIEIRPREAASAETLAQVFAQVEPELDSAREKIGDLAKNEEDLLIYALYPTTGKEFLEKKYKKA